MSLSNEEDLKEFMLISVDTLEKIYRKSTEHEVKEMAYEGLDKLTGIMKKLKEGLE